MTDVTNIAQFRKKPLEPKTIPDSKHLLDQEGVEVMQQDGLVFVMKKEAEYYTVRGTLAALDFDLVSTTATARHPKRALAFALRAMAERLIEESRNE